jgi:outer membrane cobalamin receptor
LSYTTPRFLGSALTLDAKAFYKFSRLDFQNPDPIGSFEIAVDDSHRLHSAGLDIAQQLIAFDLAQVVYGGNLLYDHVDSTQIGQKDRISGGVFLEAPLFLFPRLTITPMVRYDLYSDFPAALTYKVSTVWRLTDEASLKASGGKSYRAPTLNDLYWPLGSFGEIGNPDLKPETSYSADLGFSLAKGSVEWDLFAFARYVLDGIQWVFTTMYQPQNIGEAVYPGAETDLKLTLFRKIQLKGSYTFLYSYVLKSPEGTYTFGDNRRAAYAPVHAAAAAVQYDNGRTLLRVDGQFVAGRFTGVEGELFTRTLDSYFLLNAEARQQLTPNLALSLAGKNLLNQVYQTVNGYAMPPLSFWVGAEISF